MKDLFRFSIAFCLFGLIGGCAGGAGGGGTASSIASNAASTAASSAASQSVSAVGSSVGTAMGGGVTGAAANALVQSMASSVLNGQIGSQLTSTDQTFRLQQLNGAAQSGSLNQAQQWTNPQTGNTIALTPVGQQATDPTSGQNCRSLEETVTLKNGQTLREARRACQNASGQWVLTQ